MTKPRLLLLAILSMPSALAAGQQYAPDVRVDSVFAEYDRPGVPGCAVGVYRDGKIQYARGYGLADLERRVPISPRTVFDIGSTSKQFTAASILLLQQDGKLSLDDDVRRFLPELPVYDRPITIRHLLHHTSGIRDYIGLLRLAGVRYDDVATADDALQMIARQRALNFSPGAEHLYSNSGYFLLSLIVERAGGRSLRDVARERIFAPLGMTHTEYLGSYNDVIPDRAIGYEPADSGFQADMPRWLQLGDGAVFTTVEDLVHWGENFRTTQVGGPAMRDALLTRGRLNNGKELNYALGLMHGELRGLATVYHGGSWGGYVAEYLRVPEQRYGVAVLCNRADADPPGLALKVAAIHLEKAMSPLPAAAGSAPAAGSAAAPFDARNLRPLATYAGSYRSKTSTTIVTIRVVDGALRVVEPAPDELIPHSADEFEVRTQPVRLVFVPGATRDAPAPQLTAVVNGIPGTVYERIVAASVSRASLAAFVGTYRSAELATTLAITQADTILSITLRNAPARPLRAVGANDFNGAGLTLEFTRDKAGKVTGLLLNQGRARGMRFEREGTGRTPRG